MFNWIRYPFWVSYRLKMDLWVYLKNTCDQSIDVMICVQESNKEWKRFHHTAMAPGDSLRAYACAGTGKYLAWGRRAGDESVVFPTIEQVNKDYTE